jgi:hypothetical protein
VQSFIKFLIMCVGAKAIHRKAQLPGSERRAYKEADKWLISLCHDNILMMQSGLKEAIQVVEDNLQLTDAATPVKTTITNINEFLEDKKVSSLKPELSLEEEKIQKMGMEIKILTVMSDGFQHADMRTCGHADMQTCRHGDMVTCRHGDMQTW